MIEIIFAPIGFGKTALATAKAIKRMYGPTARESLRYCRNVLAQMKANGFDNVAMPEKHLVYANYGICYKSPDCGERRSYDLDGFKLGFKTDKFDPMYMLPYSLGILDEAQRYFNARKFKDFDDNRSRYFEQSRKFHLDFIIIAQRLGLIDLNVKELAKIDLIEDMQLRYHKGEICKCIWKLRVWNTFREYELGAPGEEETYTFDGNIFKYYNTDEGDLLYMNGLEERNFDYKEHSNYGISPDEVQRFVSEHNQATLKAE